MQAFVITTQGEYRMQPTVLRAAQLILAIVHEL